MRVYIYIYTYIYISLLYMYGYRDIVEKQINSYISTYAHMYIYTYTYMCIYTHRGIMLVCSGSQTVMILGSLQPGVWRIHRNTDGQCRWNAAPGSKETLDDRLATELDMDHVHLSFQPLTLVSMIIIVIMVMIRIIGYDSD